MQNEVLTFREAEESLAGKLDKPTYMKYRQIMATWDSEARRQAFFSARVTAANVLAELHSKTQAVIAGKMSQAQARDLMIKYFSGDGKEALAAMGFLPPGESGSVAQLASSRRLELIFQTQVAMAQETGQYQQWQENADMFPFGVWRTGYAEEHREEHLARDGKAYSHDHPIWTQSPPGGEFGCQCYRELASQDDITSQGITPQRPDVPFVPSTLGFDPSKGLSQPPVSKLATPEIKAEVKAETKAFILPDPPVESLPVQQAIEREKVTLKLKPITDRAEEIDREVVRIENETREKIAEWRLQNNASKDGELPKPILKLKEDAEKEKKRLQDGFADSLALPDGQGLKLVPDFQKGKGVRETAESALAWVEKSVSGSILKGSRELNVSTVSKGKRSFQKFNQIGVATDAGIHDAIHGIGHFLEHKSQHLGKRAAEFLEYRTKGDKEELLSKLTGKREYGKEKAKKDKFFSPYCGKLYGNAEDPDATEIMSMGLQQMYRNPFKFFKDDPEYFSFVLLAMRGGI